MKFNGFTQKDFDTFTLDGLEARMTAIQERIQPKFRAIGQPMTDDMSAMLGNEMFLHIAKHIRRSVNPPKDTWLAISGNKRGYKQHPHFQIGLYDDHVFVWLAFIYEMPNKTKIANTFLKKLKSITNIVPNDFVISLDHTKKDVTLINEIDLQESLERFRDVKKCELLIGRHFASNDPLLSDGDEFFNVVKETFETLIPVYKLSYE